ncbi:hypothetical protein MTO96_042675 [Rhipicephalus appendiculatus]
MAPAERELFGSSSQPPDSMLAEPPPGAGTFGRFSSPLACCKLSPPYVVTKHHGINAIDVSAVAFWELRTVNGTRDIELNGPYIH